MPTNDNGKADAELSVRQFYNSGGWSVNEDDITSDAELYEDLRPCARKYVTACRLRLIKYIPAKGEHMLDMASGPLQYPEYLEYSRNYNKRYCVDLSQDALNIAEKKIKNHGKFFCGSFFDLGFQANFFDCCISLHTIYHIHKDQQEFAVRKLLQHAKPGSPVVIIYSNPFSLEKLFYFPYSLLKRILALFVKPLAKGRRSAHSSVHSNDLYFYSHKIHWWRRFSNEASIEIRTWRMFSSSFQKLFFPDNKIGSLMFQLLYRLESKASSFLSNFACYPLIVLTKK